MVCGNCLCGGISFEAEEYPGMVFNCHCSRCRRSHGAAFSTQVICAKNSLNLKTGRELLKEFESANIIRAFCSTCGSRLMNYDKQGLNYLSISLSAVNNRSDLKPIGECFVLEKLFFVQLNNSITHYSKLPQIST